MTVKQKVTIIGAGNGGHALSFHLAHLGHQVMLFAHPNFAAALNGIKKIGGIEAKGCLTGFEKLAGTTTDIKKAMNFADIVFMMVPSYAQETLFDLLVPHLRDEHILTIMSGNFGSLILRKKLKTAATLAETNSLIHACRRIDSGHILIAGIKDKLAISTLPAANTKKIIKKLQTVLPLTLLPYSNILEVAFANMNMVTHPATTLLNIGWCESKQGQFYFYSEGISKTVAKIIEKVDEERMAITNKLKFKNNLSFLETRKIFYHQTCKSIYDFAKKSLVHGSINAPNSSKFRYLTEDAPYLLLPVYQLGRLANIPCKTMKSLITLTSIMNETNYLKTGRTLQKIGLNNLSFKEILKKI